MVVADADGPAEMRGGSETNPERQHFVSRDVAAKVLDECPDADWRLIFTLARFAGLRCPTEVLGLRWSDVNWHAGRLKIEAAKTEMRFVPIFPDVRKALDESWQAAPKDAVYCVSRYRGTSANLRTELLRII